LAESFWKLFKKKKLTKKLIYTELKKIHDNAKKVKINKRTRVVIFSDLHLGTGKRKSDDFLHNSKDFLTVLKDHYLAGKYQLILNGDIEECVRFPLKKIKKTWGSVYHVFDEFQQKKKLIKIVGNHDPREDLQSEPYRLYDAVRLQYYKHEIFVYHGHQARPFYENNKKMITFFLRIANILGIKNVTAAYDSRKKYNVEKFAYKYARKRGMVSIIGHTHRPLFESLSKIEFLKFEIESLCRDYVTAGPLSRKQIVARIDKLKKQMNQYSQRKSNKGNLPAFVYNSKWLVPSLFNSGCVIGKHGFTGIEINSGRIALVLWTRDQKQLDRYQYNQREELKDGLYKVILRSDDLDYIFSRISLLK